MLHNLQSSSVLTDTQEQEGIANLQWYIGGMLYVLIAKSVRFHCFSKRHAETYSYDITNKVVTKVTDAFHDNNR